jgi:hypothetical protein
MIEAQCLAPIPAFAGSSAMARHFGVPERQDLDARLIGVKQRCSFVDVGLVSVGVLAVGAIAYRLFTGSWLGF